MTASSLAGTILTFVAIVGIGWLLRATGALRAEDARPINAVILWVGLPAFIIKAVHGAHLDMKLIGVVGVAWAVFAVALALGLLAARLLNLPRVVAGGFILAAALGNTGYIGYPLTQAILGEVALPRAVFYDVFGTVGALVLVGLVVAERYGGGKGKLKHPVREVLGFPAVIALIVGLATRPFVFPKAVSGGLDLLASLVVPLIMISVGLSLRVGLLRKWAVPLGVLAGLRLLVAPLIALFAGGLVLGGDTSAVRLVVLQAGMPAMMLTLVVGARFELDTDFIASAIVVTTVAAALTIPLIQVVVA
jgi:predicted permease